MSGKETETLLDEVGLCVNKNMIPFDPRKPWDPSGIRLGTPAITTRGMRESEMKTIGELVNKAIEFKDDKIAKEKIRAEVKELCKRFVFYE
jgi:glycine hydroxymethyltransferase